MFGQKPEGIGEATELGVTRELQGLARKRLLMNQHYRTSALSDVVAQGVSGETL
jgi:hypothetical protein